MNTTRKINPECQCLSCGFCPSKALDKKVSVTVLAMFITGFLAVSALTCFLSWRTYERIGDVRAEIVDRVGKIETKVEVNSTRIGGGK